MDERYPIGQFTCGETISLEDIQRWIEEIKTFPKELREVVEGLGEEMLENTYREGGWTIRQLVHHIADSHLNSYIRFKLALTETNPTIKPYAEDKWAELPDSSLPIEISLNIIQSLHERWAFLLANLTVAQHKRNFIHPDSGDIPLEMNVGLYAWHGNHHLAHIRNAIQKGASLS
ncbi:YfiT family bacillithiol transferase [Ureibacillus sinduriensis]|uniref:Putative metal-dependent hydrolase CD33_10840 n=1 Tax=Ureibacillus sinduriensis BLB-1 = JCM 15800 TaxID=1384057 RepID=A0A0A3HZ01_9BACL|nr:bacillithiol transferase BstA [Ureibacillus sinduriensis]KGR75623.1 metal-dependent hydrolase [Ureibacillus sinduriensis BLB-1 = JCM 15800]